ncbi:MAG: DUF4252 domain-containing protein [Prevotellaceae bacterium]|jgi:hypothetical protein|nr:DUF4252 domain-containing protein [Prevotellaceae bacterium]
MKKRIVNIISLLSIFWLMGATGALFAQNRRMQTLDDLFAKYEQTKGVGYISISPSLLKLAKSADSKELDEVFNSIASLRILNLEITPELEGLANRIRQDVQTLVKQVNYEEIVKMIDGDSNFVIYLSKNKDKNSKQLEALLMIASEKSELVLIGITGKITQKVIDAILDGKIGIIP